MAASRRAAVTLLLAAGLGIGVRSAPLPQAPPQSRDVVGEAVGSGSLSGVVVSDASDAPVVRRASVELAGGGLRAGRRAISDDRGRYTFDGLGPGRYSITVNKAGYVRSFHGSRRPWRSPGRPIDLAAGEHRSDLRTVVQRGGVIAGRVIDEQGQVLPGVSLAFFERRTSGGVTQLLRANVQGSNTDDRGEYRAYGLPPGAYLVTTGGPTSNMSGGGARMITPSELQWATALVQGGAGAAGARGAPMADAGPDRGPSVMHSRLYYPGTPDPATASVVVIEPGQERTGIDISLRLVPVARLTGATLLPDGTPVNGVSLNIRRRDAVAGEISIGMGARLHGSGLFEFPAVEPGTYVVTARASSAPIPPPMRGAPGVPPPAPVRREMDLWAELDVHVDGRDLEGLALRLQPGMTVSGRVVYRGRSGDSAPQASVRLSLAPGSPPLPGVQVTQTSGDTFTLSGVAPGHYTIVASAVQRPDGSQPVRWMAESAMWNGKDLLDEPFTVRPADAPSDVVVTFTDQGSELSGRMLDGQDKPVTEFFVMAFAAEPERWRVGSRRIRSPIRPQPDGSFRFPDLPPGEYILAALADYDTQDIYESAFLEQVAQAGIRVAIAAGTKAVQDIRVK